MQAAATPLDVLYVSERTARRRPSDSEGLRLSEAAADDCEAWPDPAAIDCLLVGPVGDTAGTVTRLREAYPETPLVAFAAEADGVDRILSAGATDVLRSAPAETPAELLTARVENVCETAAGPRTPHDTEASLLEHVSDNLRDVVWINDPATRTVEFVSAAFEEVWGRPREYLLGSGMEPFYETVHPEDRDRVREVAGGIGGTSRSYEVTYRIVRPDGEVRWIHDRALGVHEAGAERVVGIARDITEHREREHELERQNDLFTKAQEIANVGAWEYNPDGQHLWTENLYDLFDRPRDASLALPDVEEHYHPEDRERVLEALDRAVESGEPFSLEVRALTGNDETRWVHLRGDPQTENGEVARVRGTIQDITERKEREHELERSREFLDQIQQVGDVGGWEYDFRTETVRLTDRTCELLDLQPEMTLPVPDIVEAHHPAEQEEVEAAFRGLRTEGEPLDLEIRVASEDDGLQWVYSYAEPVYEDGEVVAMRGVSQDITERKERERKLESQRDELAQLDRINRIIRDVDTALVGATTREEIEQAVCDQLSESGRYRHTLVFRASGDELALQATSQDGDAGDLTGLDEIPPSAPTRRAVETARTRSTGSADADSWTVSDALADGADSLAAIPLTYGDRTYGVLVVCAARDETFDERELDVLDELGGTVGYAISAVESREREATLSSLYEATQDLLAAEHPQAVCDVVVETAASVLDPPGIGIFLFDDAQNVLELAAGTDDIREFYDGSTTFGPSRTDSITWQTYVSGEERFFPDVRSSDHVADTETDARTGLFVPLGDHGVFVVATAERAPFDDQKRRLIGLLAATTEAALDRVAGRAGIRERDRRLAERSSRLERLDALVSMVGDIDERVRRAGTPEAVERAVCQRLVETSPYALAWVGAVPPDGTAVEPRTWADSESPGQGEQTYLDEVSFALDGETPAARAATTGEVVSVPGVTDRLHEENWARAALERDYQSALVVPLTHGDTIRGVLAVYATAPEAFDDAVRSTVERLGETIPHVEASLERDRTVLAGRAVELELSLPDPETFLNAVAATVDAPVQYRETTPTPAGERVTFALQNPPVEAVHALEDRFVTVESLDVVERADETVFRATFSGSTVPMTLLSCGAVPRDVLARRDSTTATVRLPHDVDVRRFLDRVEGHYPGVELVSRRDVEASDTTAARRALAEDLTDRQREVLRTAYDAGFFRSPREMTGVELADRLGVSQPTVTHHLREAQRRLFDALFEEP